MNKCRVLLVSPLVSNVAGGISKWTANIFNYYKMAKPKEIELSPCYNEAMQSPLANEGWSTRIIKGVKNYIPLIKKVRSGLRGGNIDVVHICTSASIGLIKDLAIIRLARKRNVKSVVHFHFGRIPAIFEHKNWERWLIERVIGSSDKVVVMDMASYKTLKEYGYGHVAYVPNPLSLDTQAFIESDKDIKRVPNKVVFIGQMLETKGIFELAQACEQIDNVKVCFIGPLPNKETVDKLKNQISADKLEICGAVPFEQVIKEMKSAAVFALPTYTEGFPNVIIESMACGCPIVTTPVGAIPEMLDIEDSECGICVPVKDVEALKKAILFLLRSPKEAFCMGERAKERVNKEYSIQKVWGELERVWI